MEKQVDNKKKRKFVVMAVALLLIAFIGIGYAYLSKTLTINGNVSVDSSFNIVYGDTNVAKSGPESTSANFTATAITDESKSTVTVTVVFTLPGQTAVVTVPVRNTGEVAAVLTSITPSASNTTVEGLSFVITGIAANDTINAGANATITITCAWDSAATTVPAGAATYEFSLLFSQKTA